MHKATPDKFFFLKDKHRKSAVALFVCLGLSLYHASCIARPTSYQGGWMSLAETQGEQSSWLIHYSLTAFTSVGYRIEYHNTYQNMMHLATFNWLVFRKNLATSQANIYLLSGAGFGYPLGTTSQNEAANKDKSEQAWQVGTLGLLLDWETRRYFTQYQNRWIGSDLHQQPYYSQSIKLGIAPYVAQYNSLHTWLMVEGQQRLISHQNTAYSFFFIGRFFKGEHLFEAGYSVQKELLFKWYYQF